MAAPTRPNPIAGDAFDRQIQGQQATQDRLRFDQNRRAAAEEAYSRFPGLPPEQLLPVAKEIETQLNHFSSPEYAAELRLAKEREGVEKAGQAVGNAAITGGGLLGNFVGGPAGGVIGSFGGGLVDSGIRAITSPKDVSVRGALTNARNQASYELLGFSFVDSTLGAVNRFFRGNKAVADEITESFNNVGMRPALQDISDNFWTESSRTVLGSLPFANKPFKKRAQRAAGELRGQLDEFVASASPDWEIAHRMVRTHGREATAKFVEELNRGAFDNLAAGFSVLRKERDGKFEVLRKTAEQLEARAQDAGYPLVSPTTDTRAAIGQLADRFQERSVFRLDGTEMPMTPELEKVAAFTRDVGENVVPRNMTFMQLTALKKRISDQIDEVSDNPTAASFLQVMKHGVEQDMVRAAHAHPQLGQAYDDAMEISEEFITLLQDISTRKLQRVHKGFGRQELQEVATDGGGQVIKNAGSVDLSQTVDILAKSASPNEVRQFYGALRRGVGEPEAQRTMQLALGKKVRAAVESSLKEAPERAADAAFVPNTLLRELGIESPAQKSFGSMMAMFETAGIPAARAVNLSHVLDALYSVKNPRVSQMLARQTNLGGFRTMLKSLTAGAIGGKAATAGAAATGVLPAVSMFMLSRSYGKWMTVPWRARAVVAMADSRLPGHARTAAAISLFTDKELWSSDDPSQAEKMEAVRQEVWSSLQTPAGQKAFLSGVDEQLKAGGYTSNAKGKK